MRTEFNERQLEELKKVTGVCGGRLYLLVGAAVATATLGKVPAKKDLAYYLGMTEHELNKTSSEAVTMLLGSATFQSWRASNIYGGRDGRAQHFYYMLAADLVATEKYCPTGQESPERCIARCLLNRYMHPSELDTRALFSGYLICLEYLESVARGLKVEVPSFLKMRYGGISMIPGYLRSFCDHINTNRRSGASGLIAPEEDGYLGVLSKLQHELEKSILE